MAGLANLGNTCFLNSVLQALVVCEPLHISCPTRTSKKVPLFQAFQDLMKELKQSNKTKEVVIPRDFLKTLLSVVRDCDDDWYQPRHQADAAECLHYILDAIHESVYRTVTITIQGHARTPEEESKLTSMKAWSAFFQKEYSPVVEEFYGQHQLRVTCETCGTVSERYEPWSMLKLPIPGGEIPGSRVPTLEDCLNAFYASERIEDYHCETCKEKRAATLQTRISKLPHILILVFKRFTNTGLKIRGAIQWNVDTMSFHPWSAFQKCPYTKSPIEATFQTFAVIEHMGSAHSGHYHMNRRDDSEWINYDDSSVQSCNAPIVTPDSYILFLSPK